MTDPLSPAEVVKLIKRSVPDQVVEVFNEFLVDFYDKDTKLMKVKVTGLIDRIKQKMDVVTHQIWAEEWIETAINLYRTKGWEVWFEKDTNDVEVLIFRSLK